MTNTKPYALYARTSTDKQDISKQVYTLKKWAVDRGVTYEVYADDDTSGGSFDNRPAYANLMLDITRYAAVVVYKLDRMGRDTKGMLDLVDTLNQRGVRFISLTEKLPDNLSQSTAMERAFMQQMMVFAELERNHTREKVQWGMNVIKERNNGLPKAEQHNLGRPPRGFSSKNGKLFPHKKKFTPPHIGTEV